MKKSAEVDPSSLGVDAGEWDVRQKSSRPTLKILALFETNTVSGPAKNFFQFCGSARKLSTGPLVDLVIVTFERTLGHGRKG